MGRWLSFASAPFFIDVASVVEFRGLSVSICFDGAAGCGVGDGDSDDDEMLEDDEMNGLGAGQRPAPNRTCCDEIEVCVTDTLVGGALDVVLVTLPGSVVEVDDVGCCIRGGCALRLGVGSPSSLFAAGPLFSSCPFCPIGGGGGCGGIAAAAGAPTLVFSCSLRL